MAEEHPAVAAHLDELSCRAACAWMRDRLGIERLGPQPSRAFVVAQSDPAAVPVEVPAGTELRSKDDDGNPRMYRTVDTLIATGASVIDAIGYVVESARDGVAKRSESDGSFTPFPPGAVAPHALYLASDELLFAGGDTMKVRVDFETRLSALWERLQWHHSTSEGLRKITNIQVGDTYVDLTLRGECTHSDLFGATAPFLKATFPPDEYLSGLTDFSFTTAKVSVVERVDVVPDGGFYNDGVVDISREFKPFGDVPRRGDSFYIQADEALAKNLESLTVRIEMLDETEASISAAFMYPLTFQNQYADYISVTPENAGIYSVLNWLSGGTVDMSEPSIEWQLFDGEDWLEVITHNRLETRRLAPSSGSEPTEVAGVGGRFLRLFLAQGDFGWEHYLADIATFAAQAANFMEVADATLLEPPKPPQLARLRLDYTTKPTTVERVVLESGPARYDIATLGQTIWPFDDPLRAVEFPRSAFFLGLDGIQTGITQTVLVMIDPASACSDRTQPPDARWEYWGQNDTGDRSQWNPLPIVDGTSWLRTSGVLRFVAPNDWQIGCRDVDRPDGRWLRMVTSRDDLVGTIDAVTPDVVVAEHPDLAATPAADPESLKGPHRHIDGIKKLTNPYAGLPGRGIEPLPEYRRRAPTVVRHRRRNIQPWDYEQRVMVAFSEVAAVRCLPHFDGSGGIVPGAVGLVVIPHGDSPRPSPTADLLSRIEQLFSDGSPVHARVVPLCPSYEEVTIGARVVLAPGVAALDARTALTSLVDRALKPTETSIARLGQPLYPSQLVALLERSPHVDRLESFEVVGPVEVPIRPDPITGLVVSSGTHQFDLVEQL
jgi:hypothetical protein